MNKRIGLHIVFFLCILFSFQNINAFNNVEFENKIKSLREDSIRKDEAM